jgi:prepilin-type N-terminal cleavage/methylation domain-containing protein
MCAGEKAGRRSAARPSGFTIIEILVVLAILGIMASLAAGVSSANRNQACYEGTVAVMEEIKNAILGTPRARITGAPRYSGYVTDMGELPELLGAYSQPVGLWTDRLGRFGKQNLPGWNYGQANRIWAGWNGPYIDAPTGVLIDGWGHPVIFKDSKTHPAQVHAGNLMIKSLGANGIESSTDTGFDEDMEIVVRRNEYAGVVAGYAGRDVSAVIIYYPEKGHGRSAEAVLDADGYFRFEKGAGGRSDIPDIPFGIRSIGAAGVTGGERIYVFSVEPTANWVGTLQ